MIVPTIGNATVQVDLFYSFIRIKEVEVYSNNRPYGKVGNRRCLLHCVISIVVVALLK